MVVVEEVRMMSIVVEEVVEEEVRMMSIVVE